MDHFSLFASKVAFHTWPTGVLAINEAVARNISLMNCSRCVKKKNTVKNRGKVCVCELSSVIYSIHLR